MANEYENWRAAWGMPGLMRRGQDEYIESNYLGSKSPLKQVVGEEYGETITPYLGAERPIPFPGERHYIDQGDFAGRYDPAFGHLEDFIGGSTRYPDPYQSGRIKTFNTYGEIPRLQQDDFYENFRDQAIAENEITEAEPLEVKSITQNREVEDLPYDELDDLEAQNVTPTFLTSEEQEEYLERVRNMSTIQDQGIPAADKWRNFLSKVTRQPYRPAMGGVTMGSGKTYSPAQLNKMNALGGWYSEPSRAARRTQKRVANMLARRSEGKPIGTTNLGQFTGRDEGRGSYTATTAPAPAGVTTSSGMHGGRHYMRGGRVGYNKGGRVGILSIL